MGLLVDMNTLLTSETNKYIGDCPDTPNNLTCIYNTGGYDPKHVLGKNVAVSHEEPTFQIRIRDTSYSNGISRAETIKGQLNGKTSTTINGNNYISIFMTSDIISLGKDSKDRWDFTINFKVKVKRG